MAIEFEHKGQKWKTDTPEEAIKLREQLEQKDQGHSTRMSPWTLGTIMDLLKGVGPMQNALLEVMATKLWITSAELIEELGLESELSLAGVLSGLSKQLRAMGIMTHSLYQIKTDWNGKNKVRSFMLAQEFKMIAELHGWPQDWKGPKEEEEGTIRL